MSDSPTILIVEDEDYLRELLYRSFQRLDYQVFSAACGQEALDLFAKHPVDVVVLDIRLPDVDGWSICGQLRRISDVLIVILSAFGESDDVVKGLNLGADEYVAKPFSFRVLSAQIRALLQRESRMTEQLHIRTNALEFRSDSLTMRIYGQSVTLTAIEHRLLYQLLRRVNHVVQSDFLLRAVWGDENADKSTLLHTHVRRLRLKMDVEPMQDPLIESVHGIGYRFRMPSELDKTTGLQRYLQYSN